MRKLHIMHVIDSLARGGAERALIDIANQTARDGYQVSVCVTRSNCELAGELCDEIKLWILNRRARFDRKPMLQFASMVASERVDILHAHLRSTFSFLAFLKMLRLIQPPIILHDHFGDTIELERPVMPLWFRLWGRRYLSRYVGVYPKLGESARSAGVPVEKINVIEYALNFSRIRSAEPIDLRKEFNIPGHIRTVGLVVGNIRPAKGIDTLLHALSHSTRRDSVVILVVGGERDPAYAAQCRALQRALRLNQTVIFTGERSDVPRLLHSADFAVMPSRSESGPLVLLEFMAVGLPFVSTLVGNTGHRVSELGVSEFVPKEDPTALAQALDRLLELSPQERKQRGKPGQTIALEHFEIQGAVKNWYALYDSVAIEGKRR